MSSVSLVCRTVIARARLNYSRCDSWSLVIIFDICKGFVINVYMSYVLNKACLNFTQEFISPSFVVSPHFVTWRADTFKNARFLSSSQISDLALFLKLGLPERRPSLCVILRRPRDDPPWVTARDERLTTLPGLVC